MANQIDHWASGWIVDIINKSEWLTNASYFYNVVSYYHP